MKILFVSDNFPPEVNAPASRTYEHAKRWVKKGADVTVLTSAPNFPKGKLHTGYANSWRSVENIDGIRVVRVKTFITGNEGFALRILDYVSFMLSAVFFGSFEKQPDVVVGTSPQFFAAVGAWMLSVVKWRPFVFELRDLWPASIVTVGAMKKGLTIRMLEALELFLYRRAAVIVPVTESFKRDLIERQIDGRKIHVVRNGVDLARFHPREKCHAMARELGLEGKFVVAYLGTHGMAHALDNVLHAAERLAHEDGIRFLLVGDGARKKSIQAMAQDMGLKNVVFRDSVAKEEMPDLWSVCDVALVHLKDEPVFATVIPSKIFEAFGMGKPVLIVQPQGEAADIVTAAGAGEWVRPEDPGALAASIARWHADPCLVAEYAKRAGISAARHSRSELAAAMLKILSTTAGASARTLSLEP
jgi:glycosyltransferase involved in cell wall biosynthesis